ncbi:MAG TPA: type VI secretion system protein TssA [Burkholderiaceae bacterium]|nr:type VI secretion system protein TssA [Burkholderiaceae bacterium]
MLDIEQLCKPISDDSPCGADLEYDAAFLALEQAAQSKSEQQFGDTVIAAEGPDWRSVRTQATDLFERTKDLRVCVHLLRANLAMEGFRSLADGLCLIRELCSRYWDGLFPLLDADYDDDPMMRMNALSSLAHAEAGLADVRNSSVGRVRGASFQVKSFEFAANPSLVPEGAVAPSDAELRGFLSDLESAEPGALDALLRVKAEADQLQTWLNEQVGSDRAVDLKPLRDVCGYVAKQIKAVQGDSAESSAAGAEESTFDGGASGGVATGAVTNREDAIRQLERLCDLLERTDPANPGPLFIRRGVRLLRMNFIDIIRDLSPESLQQIEHQAGLPRE